MGEELVEDLGTCALEGCENPLPPPARDERGRLKGGKPSRYCGKAHADEASRRRRALEAVGVEEPLQMLRALGGETRTVVDTALVEFQAIRQRWDELDAGAVAQSATDRAEKASALLRVEQAERAAEDAERARVEAVTSAAEDRQRRAAAEKAAEEAQREAEQTRKAAWEQTAEHERARGQAESRATLAEQGQQDALDRLEVARRQLREVTEVQQETARRLAEAVTAAERAEAAQRLAESQVGGAEERARLTGEAARLAEQVSTRAQAETEAARAAASRAEVAARAALDEAAQLRAARALAEQRLADLEKHTKERLEDLRAQLNQRENASAGPESPGEEAQGT